MLIMPRIPGGTVRSGLVIAWTEHLEPTVNANPRYRIHFTDGTAALTQSDASCAYGIDDPEFRDTPLTVTFTRAGRIRYLARQEPAS
jgi:hypothetical protein